jgi:hypothetical protein
MKDSKTIKLASKTEPCIEEAAICVLLRFTNQEIKKRQNWAQSWGYKIRKCNRDNKLAWLHRTNFERKKK